MQLRLRRNTASSFNMAHKEEVMQELPVFMRCSRTENSHASKLRMATAASLAGVLEQRHHQIRHHHSTGTSGKVPRSLITTIRTWCTTTGTGFGRLEMRGWLTAEEVTSLRKALTSKCWMPSADEPLDGGCQDAAKHLVALLRAAEKRFCGVVFRVHN